MTKKLSRKMAMKNAQGCLNETFNAGHPKMSRNEYVNRMASRGLTYLVDQDELDPWIIELKNELQARIDDHPWDGIKAKL